MTLTRRQFIASTAASVAVSFVSEKDIRGLNRRWRGIDKPTDVLSFAYGEAGLPASGKKDESDLLGDIIVCPGRVRKQASAIGREFRQELALVVVHGFLHLLGFDHRNKRQEAVMFRLQQEILMRAGYL